MQVAKNYGTIFNITNQGNVNQSHISCHLILLRMTTVKQAKITNVSGCTEKREVSEHWWHENYYSQYGKQYGSLSED